MAAVQVAHFHTESINRGDYHQRKPPAVKMANKNEPSSTNGLTSNSSSSNTTSNGSPVNSEGITPLMLACQQGLSEDVPNILKKKPKTIKDKTRSGKVAVHFCAESGASSCVDLVLAADPYLINAQDEEGYTPLHLAVINGNKDIVRKLISAGADLNCLDNERHSLVHWATVCGEVEILEILLSNGAPASTPDIHLAHPIHYAAQMCGSVNGVSSGSRARVQSTVYGVSPKKGLQILKRLVQFGCPIDVRDQDGRQPLLWAASAGSGDAILLLVNKGAKVDAEDKDGLTAIHCAASRGHTDCLENLIALCGAEVDVIDNNGCTALFYAVTLGHADCTELLLNYGAEPNRQDRKGRTPGHCGAAKGQLETLKLLSKHGGNLWLRNVRGDLPLHEAVLSRRKDLVMWLLSQRPDSVNTPNNDGRCPIHLAALNNNVEMVKILIDHRADVNVLMRSGKGTAMTPLDAAIHKGNSAVAKFLQLHGGLPSNSLNDAALQRRLLNRSVEGQISPANSLLGSHHHPSPEDQQRTAFTSPEVFDNSLIYSRNAYDSIKQGSNGHFIATSTPIMDDGVQTDSTHYVRDMEVQTTQDLLVSHDKSTTANNTEQIKESGSNSHRKTERRRRKRSPRDGNAPGSSSDSSLDRSVNQLASRTSRKSSRRSRKGSVASVSKSLSHSSISEEKVKLSSRSKSTSIEKDETDSPSHVRKQGVTPQGSSDTLLDNTMMSEKFSELENVAVQSSETDVREEELNPEGGREVSKERDRSLSKSGKSTDREISPEKQRKSSTKSNSKDKSRSSSSKSKSRTTEDEKHSSSPDGKLLPKRRYTSKSVEMEEDDSGSRARTRSKSRSKSKSLEKDESRASKPEIEDGEEDAKQKKRLKSKSKSGESSEKEERRSKSKSKSGESSEKEERRSKAKSKSGESSEKEERRSKSKSKYGESSEKEERRSKSKSKSGESSEKEERRSKSKSKSRESSEKDEKKRSKSKSVDKSISMDSAASSKKSGSKSPRPKSAAEEGSRPSSPERISGRPSSNENPSEHVSPSHSPSQRKGSKSRTPSGKKSAVSWKDESEIQPHEDRERSKSKSPEKVKRSASNSPDKTNRSKSNSPEKVKRSTSNSPEKANRSKSNSPEKITIRSKSNSPEKISRSKSNSPEKTTRSKSNSPEKNSRSKSKSIEKESRETIGANTDRSGSRNSSRNAKTEQSTKSIISSRSGSNSPNKTVRKASKPKDDNESEEESLIDEIEAGKLISLQDAARRRSESIACNPSRSRSRSISQSRTDSLVTVKETQTSKRGQLKNGIKSVRRIKSKIGSKSEEREIVLQEALLASSKTLRPKGSLMTRGKVSNKENRSKTRTYKKDNDQGQFIDSGFSDPVGLTNTSASDEVNSRLYSEQGKSHASMKRKVITRRPSSGSAKRKSIFSSTPKEFRIPRNRNRFDTLVVNHLSIENHLDGDETNSTSRGGSITSDETILGELNDVRRRRPNLNRPRSKLTFSRGEDMSRVSPRLKKSVDVETPISVTQAMQASMRKYNLERTVFQELLELKRLQIRAGKANEQILVKRLAENYRKAGYSVNFRDYDGPYTFRNFEKYLYDQLRVLQSNRRLLPRFAPSDDLEKLSMALKKMNATKLPFLDDVERSESVCDSLCSHATHRCHHAAHAYTGVPCAAYIGNRKNGNGFLPRVNPIKAPGPTQKDSTSRNATYNNAYSRNGARSENMNLSSPMQISISPRTDTQSPITLEVQQGSNTQVFTLPTKTLDPRKNYYVSLSIKPNVSPDPTPEPEALTHFPGPGDVIDDGSISAPPPPVDIDADLPDDVHRDKHNKSM